MIKSLPGADQFEVILEILRTLGAQGYEPVAISSLRFCFPSESADHDIALGVGYGLSHRFVEFVAGPPHAVKLTTKGRDRLARDE